MRHCGKCGKIGHNRRTCGSARAVRQRGSAPKKRASKRQCGWCAQKGHNLRTCESYQAATAGYRGLIRCYRRGVLRLMQKHGIGVGTLICRPGAHDRGELPVANGTLQQACHDSMSKPQGHDTFLIQEIRWAHIAPRVYTAGADEYPGSLGSFVGRCLATKWSDGIERGRWHSVSKFCHLKEPGTTVDSELRADRSSYSRERLCPSWFVLSPTNKDVTAPYRSWERACDEGTSRLIKSYLKFFAKDYKDFRRPDSSPHTFFMEKISLLHKAYSKGADSMEFLPLRNRCLNREYDDFGPAFGPIYKKYADAWK